ncbi:hypothetical protein EXW94_19340 [Enterobacter sp. JMULE2]|uniref:hypothetical protein n=1 Tax=Enterobacter sp. JMULE2 TaxID=2518340 RepID=UPI001577110F|nr:hypothetical protein [Enterobacter sp. JMULE2]NTZ39815.1 hypothetical protein [Enterobacter sp. JMULE2]
MKELIFLLLALTSFYAFASPYDDDVLFGCFFNNQKEPKEVVILRSGDTITYMYGKQDPSGEGGVIPEITIKKSARELTKKWESNSSEGFTLYELNIPNGKYAYNAGYLNKEGKVSGSVGIYKDGKWVSSLDCSDVWENHLGDPTLMKGIPDLNNDATASSETELQGDVQPSQQPNSSQPIPVKIQIQDIPKDYKWETTAEHKVTRHIYVYSLENSVTITGLNIDRSNCYSWNVKPVTLSYGKRYDFNLPISYQVAYSSMGWSWIEKEQRFSKCMWSEVEVKTNSGNYTFNLNN